MDRGFVHPSLAMAMRLDPCRAARSLSKAHSHPPEGVTFRARESADTPDLFELFNEPVFLENASTHGRFDAVDEFEAWLNGIASGGKFEVVAQVGADVVAFGGLYTFTDLMSHCGSLMLGVRQGWQNQKIGSMILRLLLLTAEVMAGLTKVQLTVFTNNTSAIHLYKSFGFEVEGLHRRFSRRGDGFADAYAMALFFDQPGSARQRSDPRHGD